MFDLIRLMHQRFGFAYEGEPRVLPDDEFEFRMKAFQEEIDEYKEARSNGDLEGQLDALLDLTVFVMGAAEQHGFEYNQGMIRVMSANMQKQVVASAEESKRGHKFDLKKPPEWREPYLTDLINPPNFYRGVILLEGPDATGKTTLANYLVDNHNALYIHSTWSEDLETRMTQYLEHSLQIAGSVSRRQLVVLDRNWLSELVYTDVFRKDVGRAEWHMRMHTLFISALQGLCIYCLPSNPKQYMDHFADMVEDPDRKEMYSNMADVYNAYLALWEGLEFDYTFKGSREYIGKIFENGGLNQSPHFIRYDFNNEGQDLKSFFESLPMNQEKDIH